MKKIIFIITLIFITFAFCKPADAPKKCAAKDEVCKTDADCCTDLQLKCKGKEGKKVCK